MSDEAVNVFWIEPVDELGRMYRRTDTGETMLLSAAPVGAMWDMTWGRGEKSKGADDIALVVVLPGIHHWLVDSQCSNCDRKGEQHKCWVRHGDPRDPQGLKPGARPLHIDKDAKSEGVTTCTAGGGSVMIAGWHGFLHNGKLTTASEPRRGPAS